MLLKTWQIRLVFLFIVRSHYIKMCAEIVD